MAPHASRERELFSLGDVRYTIGIDLGGTKMVGAVLDAKGSFIHQIEEPTKAQMGPRAVYENLLAHVRRLIAESGLSHEQIDGVGIGVPGVVSRSGVVTWAPALKWKDVALAEDLKGDLRLPVHVENDVNQQAMGEYHHGVGQGADPMVYLAIGTGLGSGIIINGQLLAGANNAAGEVCNMVTDRSQLGKAFQGFGYLEGFASGTGVAKLYEEAYGAKHSVLPGDLDGRQVFQKARQKDPLAQEVVREFTSYLALAIVNIATVLDPEVIVLGGGVARNADLFMPYLYELCEPVLQAMPRLAVSELDTAAGIKGAAAMVRNKVNR
jgi:glucokinase-like ROK family protein